MHNKVIWNEGMFLQPQHFQQQESYIENIISQKTTFINHNQWGIKKLSLNYDLLRLGKIGLTELSGIFPDGTCFNAPTQDNLPDSRDITPGTANITLYIGTPLINENAISLDDKKSHERYNTTIKTVKNNIKNINLSSELLLGQLNIKILLETDDLSQYTTIPIARIEQTRSDSEIILDRTFIPSCLSIFCTPYLRNQVNDMLELLNNRARMLAGRINETQQSANAELIDMIMLQIVNRYVIVFDHMILSNTTHPEQVFHYCNLLYAEMSTYTTQEKKPNRIEPYHHKNPNKSYQKLLKLLKKSLNVVIEQDATQIPMQRREFGLWIGQIDETITLDKHNLVLSVYCKDGNENLQLNFLNQVKVAPINHIKELVSRAIPGITLHPLQAAPRQIPYSAQCTYFRLEKNNSLWSIFKHQPTIAFHISGTYNSIQLELWAIKE